jgi:hypothetical protein
MRSLFVLWAPQALPSVVTVTAAPPDLADPEFQHTLRSLAPTAVDDGAERIIESKGTTLRVHIDQTGAEPLAVLLPLDQLFEIRATAAIRLWRSLSGRNPGPDPAALPKTRRNRLILALRAIDGRREGATYREIADVLFGVGGISGRDWKNHDLRDRTIRLVRYGHDMMRGGYRRLLLHPYRRL